MSKYLWLFIFVAVLSINLNASPAYADVEAISATIKGVSNVQAELKKAQDLQASIADAQQSIEQGFKDVKGNLEDIIDTASNPAALADMAKAEVMQGLQGRADGSATAEESIEDVKTTYNRVSGPNDITRAKKLAADINKMLGDSAARLYARALILRQDLLAEENPDDKLETIEDALKASQTMLIQSSKRWNKILEMQAYINEFGNTYVIQNFKLEQEEVADE